jgi:polar amino acid transport system substrate-binding protein
MRALAGLLVTAVLALGALSVLPADAAHHEGAKSPALARIVKSGKLRVGTSGSMPPLNAVSKGGEFIGMEIDLARVLAEAMGVEAVFVKKDFKDLIGALEKGDVDIVLSGMTITPERNMRVAFVGPYFVSGKSILTKSQKFAAVDEAGDLDVSEVTLTALAGSTSQNFVEVLIPKAKLIATKNYDDGVKLVLDGKADALVADYPICVLSLLRNQGAGLATLMEPLTIEPIGIALPPGDALFINLVENYLGALEATGALGRIRSRWFDQADWIAELP